MIKFIESKRNIIMILSIVFAIVSLSDTTYSLFINVDNTNTFSYGTGILELEVSEDKEIVINNAFPTIDSTGMQSEPYELVIKNNGNITYKFDLKMLSTTADNTIDTKYIKVMVDDDIPKTLYKTSNIIKENLIVYPKEEKKIKIRVWLDISTPNEELGKTFVAKIATNGESFYKTIDSSGANHPSNIDNMIPVYYNETKKEWLKADESNTDINYPWYNYDKSIWANAVKIKENDKMIYDITGKHNIKISKTQNNNQNIVIDDKYLDLSFKYNKHLISTVMRVKFDNINQNKIYLITNENITYYFDTLANKFTFKIGNVLINSSTFNIKEKVWYILGYTYDENKINFYVNGKKISSSNLDEIMKENNSFKIGTNDKLDVVSKISVSDIYIYNDILKEEEIEENYQKNINVITDSLEAGYNKFIPMTKEMYYSLAPLGTKIENSDITEMYVWIPRYKYQVFNIDGEVYNEEVHKKGINIVFEKDYATTGTITCEKNECYSDAEKKIKATKENNGEYYTHPAFKALEEDVSGFWVSKYEISKNDNIIRVKSNSEITTNEKLSTLYKSIKKLSPNNNYKMITNTEWGAITYLAHSKYGICPNERCNELTPNKTYISGGEPLDSTTGNIYGVYDMAGSANEFVMANYEDELGSISLNNSYFNNIAISNKDYDLYPKDGFILGDATKEISINKWNKGSSTFINEVNNWFVRGGNAYEENASIYNYKGSSDIESEYTTTRITIK